MYRYDAPFPQKFLMVKSPEANVTNSKIGGDRNGAAEVSWMTIFSGLCRQPYWLKCSYKRYLIMMWRK